jgi:aspartate/methionine/tyrosine aminotransferase
VITRTSHDGGVWHKPTTRPAGSNDTTLTDQEIQASHLAHFDLGPGYPQLPVPEYVADLYLDDTIETLSLKFAPAWTPEKQAFVDAELAEAVRRFLHIPSSVGPIHATFSGSVALDRAFTAAIQLQSRSRMTRIQVITTSPSIDIMRLFLEERRSVDIHFVESRASDPWGLDSGAVLARLHSLTPQRGRRRGVIVLLTSPENPTGQCWSEDDLRDISAECARVGATLIVDHSFLQTGVQPPGYVAPIWNVTPDAHDWIATWDTGKTFGLNEDKLGFLVCGSERTETAVRRSLGVLQFGVSRRQKLFFTELLRRAYFFDYLPELREICRANLKFARQTAPGAPILPIAPNAGSLLLLQLTRQMDDEKVRGRLLSRGIGVVAGNVFFHGTWRPRNLIRIALARDPAYFRQSFEALLQELNDADS